MVLVALAACSSEAPPELPEDSKGIVVEEVVAGYALERGGVRSGDRILSWESETLERGRPVSTPFDLLRLEIEEAPQREVTLLVERSGKTLRLRVPDDEWRITTRPALPPAAAESYRTAGRLAEEGRGAEAAEHWRSAAEVLADPRAGLWIRLQAAVADPASPDARPGSPAGLVSTDELGRLIDLYTAEDVDLILWAWMRAGDLLEESRDLAGADRAYEEALRLEPGKLTEGALFRRRGWVSLGRGRLDVAQTHFGRAVDAYAEGAPGSSAEAAARILHGFVALQLNQLDLAAERLARAETMIDRVSPNGAVAARVRLFLGELADRRGDLRTADARYREAIAAFRSLGFQEVELGMAHMGRGIVAWRRGHLATAEGEYREARQIFDRLPNSENYLAWVLQNLGLVAQSRGDLEASEDYLQRSLNLRLAQGRRSMRVSYALVNLGAAVLKRGDLPRARRYLEEGLDLVRQLRPGDEAEAAVLASLAELAVEEGRLDEAEERYREATEITERLSPGGYDHANRLFGQGELARRRGRLEAAEALHQEALRIRSRITPASAEEALSLHALATVHREGGRRNSALVFYRRAVAALEAQRGRLGGDPEGRSHFSERYAPLYRDYVELLLELGEEEAAFHALERYRGRSLLAMLAERDLVLERQLPAELIEDRRRLHREYEATQRALRSLNAASAPAQVDELLGRLRDLRQERIALAGRLGELSPRLASLEKPEILDLSSARQQLDPGTVLLSYGVTESQTLIFVLARAESLRVIRQPIGRRALEERIKAFRYLIEVPRLAGESRRALVLRGGELYRDLIAAAGPLATEAERLLLVPDGPLHSLPFAALVEDSTGERPHYLVEARPVHVVASASVYAELLERRLARADDRLVLFGDPQTSPVAGGASTVRQLPELEPLPGTRREAAELASLFPQAEVFLGAEASEERAKSVDQRARFLHFACHAEVDERYPLDSFLALAPSTSGGEESSDGFLRAWEIMEDIQLQADLVTLSGCETAAGEELAGEGMIGLTYAFHYAGARSVVASQWRVEDRSSAALMARFYSHLKQGKSKDAALRLAQLELIRGPVDLPAADRRGAWRFLRPLTKLVGREAASGATFDASHPFYWAGFQVIGDWR